MKNASFCPNCGAEVSRQPYQNNNQYTQNHPPKKLFRSRNDRIIAGVCGGIGKYLNVDSNLVRIIWIFTVLTGGAGLILYLIAVLLIPESPMDPWREQ